jgi:hypothetical protein
VVDDPLGLAGPLQPLVLGDDGVLPPKPQRMRQATYRRLRAEARRYSDAMAAAAAERFGMAPEEFEDFV